MAGKATTFGRFQIRADMNQQKSITSNSVPKRPADHPMVAHGRIGVLLANLGTPDATDYKSMRRYLKEFLSDPRVIEIPRVVWWPLLNLVILSRRPQKSGENYKRIWNQEKNESPLRTITRSQSDLLGEALTASDPRLLVDWAMRYGQPSIGDRLKAMMQAGADRILFAPLYPQYSATTTATAFDRVSAALREMRWQPAIRTLPPYYDHPAYIEALATSLQAGLANLAFEPEVVLASYHGMPKLYLKRGDPYYCHCVKTTRLLRDKLGWGDDRLPTTFQSLFGRAEWLRPYTIETVTELAKKGVKRIAVITPGFAADCVETLEEIAIGNAEAFHHAGGQDFAAIPCLNDSEAGMAMLETLVRDELKGWA